MTLLQFEVGVVEERGVQVAICKMSWRDKENIFFGVTYDSARSDAVVLALEGSLLKLKRPCLVGINTCNLSSGEITTVKRDEAIRAAARSHNLSWSNYDKERSDVACIASPGCVGTERDLMPSGIDDPPGQEILVAATEHLTNF